MEDDWVFGPGQGVQVHSTPTDLHVGLGVRQLFSPPSQTAA